MEEKWARIPGFPKYEISNLGKIEKLGRTKRIPMKVSKDGNYVYASLNCGYRQSKQINLKTIMDQCFDDHIYVDHSTDDLEGEVWKDVVGWENSYEVSNFGRMRTKLRYRLDKNGNLSVPINPKIKEAYVDWDGYERTSLYEDNRTKLVGVHRVVAEAFIPNPKNKPQVNHINGIKVDNRPENLEWVTNTENIRHSIELGLRDVKINSRPVLRLSDNKRFESIAELHREIGGCYNEIVHLLKMSNNDPVMIYGSEYKYVI